MRKVPRLSRQCANAPGVLDRIITAVMISFSNPLSSIKVKRRTGSSGANNDLQGQVRKRTVKIHIGMETAFDEVGVLPCRPINFECNLKEGAC